MKRKIAGKFDYSKKKKKITRTKEQKPKQSKNFTL